MTTTTADQASPRPMAGAAAEPPPEKVAHPPVAERAARGRGVRTSCPRQVHTAAAIEARDPVALLEANAPARIEELAPIRYGRMLTSPFAFYRGAAAIMAHDLAPLPRRLVSEVEDRYGHHPGREQGGTPDYRVGPPNRPVGQIAEHQPRAKTAQQKDDRGHDRRTSDGIRPDARADAYRPALPGLARERPDGASETGGRRDRA